MDWRTYTRAYEPIFAAPIYHFICPHIIKHLRFYFSHRNSTLPIPWNLTSIPEILEYDVKICSTTVLRSCILFSRSQSLCLEVYSEDPLHFQVSWHFILVIGVKVLRLKINIYSTKIQSLSLFIHTFDEVGSGDFRLVTNYACVFFLTLILLTRRIGWAPNNARNWQIGFKSAFKGLMTKL